MPLGASPLVEQHLGVDGQVVGRAEEAGVAGDAAEGAGAGVVDDLAGDARRACGSCACQVGFQVGSRRRPIGRNRVSVMPRGLKTWVRANSLRG